MKFRLVVFFTLTLSLVACKSDLNKGFETNFTSSVAESRKFGLLYSEYRLVSPDSLRIFDSVQLKIQEAYVERGYIYGDTIQKLDFYQMVIIADVNLFCDNPDTTFSWNLDDFAIYNKFKDVKRRTHAVKMRGGATATDTIKISVMGFYPNPDENQNGERINVANLIMVKK